MDDRLREYDLEREEKKTRVKRETAKKNIDMVLDRIKDVNANMYYLYYIDKAVLFGSYLNSTKEILGDVDIALYHSPKLEFEDVDRLSVERAYNHGISDIFMIHSFAREEVLKYIKNRKVSLSFHDGAL